MGWRDMSMSAEYLEALEDQELECLILTRENDRLRSENIRLCEALEDIALGGDAVVLQGIAQEALND